MLTETIFVGTELLLGNIVNTNAAYLANQLAGLGLTTYYQTTVGDNAERLSACIKQALKRSDIIILSGGLGPTQDDITKETAAKVLKREMYKDERTVERIKAYFDKRGRKMTDNNFRQAMIPKDAVILDNDNGTAPGILMEEGDKCVILLPGPPAELKEMFENKVIPYLKKKSDDVIYSAMVKVCGRSESEVAELLNDLIEQSGEVTVAPYAKTCEVHLRVTARAKNEKDAKALVKPVIKDIKGRLGDSVYTTHEETTLEKAVVDLLLANELTITTAESCTGGLVAGRLINIPGVSEIFKSGYVTYSNKAKRKIVGVKHKTLDKYTAVSRQVVAEMVAGAATLARADVAVAVSGYAGPDGDQVGLVYIGCSVCGVVTVEEYHLKGNREKIRENAVAEALILVRRCMLEYYSKVTFGKEEKK